MGCKQRVVKFGKWAGKFLGPVLGPYSPVAVQAVESLGEIIAKSSPALAFGGHEKRAMAIEMIKAEAKRIGHAVYDDAQPETEKELERVVRAGIEVAVASMKRGGQQFAELSDWSDEDTPVNV